MNKVILIGNLTKDPELRTTSNDVSLCRFSIAVNRKFKNSDGEFDVDFINCVAWRKTGEFINQYFSKGKKIGIVGMIQTRTYEAQDGTKRYATDVVVDEAEFVERKQPDESYSNKPSQSNKPNNKNFDSSDNLEPVEDDDLPF